MGETMNRALLRKSVGALAAAAAGFAASAALADVDVREDPSICAKAVAQSCVARLGAGAVSAPASDEASAAAGGSCEEQLAIYRACIAYAAGAGGAAAGGAPTPQSGGGSLPLSIAGLVNEKQRITEPFSHGGGCVRVSATDTTAPAVISLRTATDQSVAQRTSTQTGRERAFTQFLPAGEYLIGVEGRSRATPYRVAVTAIGDC
ncbi:MAG: hypothetical protein AAGM38_13715 [Pseudomonadota bacterium]